MNLVWRNPVVRHVVSPDSVQGLPCESLDFLNVYKMNIELDQIKIIKSLYVCLFTGVWAPRSALGPQPVQGSGPGLPIKDTFKLVQH